MSTLIYRWWVGTPCLSVCLCAQVLEFLGPHQGLQARQSVCEPNTSTQVTRSSSCLHAHLLMCSSSSLPPSLAITSCSRELYAGYSNMKVATWVKLQGDPDADNGDYVVVSSFSTAAATIGERIAASSAASALKFF